MRNLFTNHYFRIPENEFTLWFFGDVHYGVQSFDEDRFKEFVKIATTECENPYFLAMGDYLDFASFSGNKKLNSGDLHETEEEWINSRIKRDCDDFMKMIEPMRGRLVGMIGGNHQFQMANGRNTDEYICEKMGTKYLGWLSVIDLGFGSTKPNSNQQNHCRIFACHRARGGRLIGSSINGVVDMSNIVANADIYAAGDDHKRHATPKPILQIRQSSMSECGFHLKQMRQYFIRSGSFQKSYVKDTSGFAQSKLMYPVDLGAVRVDVKIKRKQVYGSDELVLMLEARI